MKGKFAAAVIGVGLGLLSPGTASAEPIDHEAQLMLAACMTMDSSPTLAGVTDVVGYLNKDEGMDGPEIGHFLAVAINKGCPEHRALVQRWMNVVSS